MIESFNLSLNQLKIKSQQKSLTDTNLLSLSPRISHGRLRWNDVHSLWHISLLPQTGPLQYFPLKLERGVVKPTHLRVIHELAVRCFQLRRRHIARVIDEVNRSGPGEEVNGGSKNEETRKGDDADEVELEMKP